MTIKTQLNLTFNEKSQKIAEIFEKIGVDLEVTEIRPAEYAQHALENGNNAVAYDTHLYT